MTNTKRVLRSRKAKKPTPSVAPPAARTVSAAPGLAPTAASVTPVQDENIGVARNARGSSSLSAPTSDIGEQPSAPVSPTGTMSLPEQTNSQGSKMNLEADPRKDSEKDLSNNEATVPSAPTDAKDAEAKESEPMTKRQRTLTKKAQDMKEAKKSDDKRPTSAGPTGVRKSKRVPAKAASAKPTASNEKPTSTISKSTASNEKPATTVAKSTSSNDKPTDTASKSTSSNAKPSTNTSKSAPSHAKPNTTTSKKTFAASQPNATHSKTPATTTTKQAATTLKQATTAATTQAATSTEQAASASQPNPSTSNEGAISQALDNEDDIPPSPADEAHLTRAEKLALTRKRFDYDFDMSPWIDAAEQSSLVINTKTRYPSYKRGGRYHNDFDQHFNLAQKMETTTGETRVVWHAPPRDWNDDRAIETLNNWLAQKFTRTTCGRVRATPIVFQDEEREFILSEYIQYPRGTQGLGGSIADSMNRQFEGKFLANGMGPRPHRSAAAVNSEIVRHREAYNAREVPGRKPSETNTTAAADKGKKRAASASAASMPPPAKKHKPQSSTTTTAAAAAAGPSNSPLDSPSLTTRALALFTAATSRSPHPTIPPSHPPSAPLSAAQYNALLTQTAESIAALKRAHAAEKIALETRNAELAGRARVLQTSLDGARTYYRRRIQRLEGRGVVVGSVAHRDLEGGAEEERAWRRGMEGVEEGEDVEMSEEGEGEEDMVEE